MKRYERVYSFVLSGVGILFLVNLGLNLILFFSNSSILKLIFKTDFLQFENSKLSYLENVFRFFYSNTILMADIMNYRQIYLIVELSNYIFIVIKFTLGLFFFYDAYQLPFYVQISIDLLSCCCYFFLIKKFFKLRKTIIDEETIPKQENSGPELELMELQPMPAPKTIKDMSSELSGHLKSGNKSTSEKVFSNDKISSNEKVPSNEKIPSDKKY